MAEFDLTEALSPGYLVDLGRLSLDGLRAKRDACAELETELSYLRRLVQARIDLILAESERRHLGPADQSPETLVELLPQILSEHSRGEGAGRLPTFFAPAQGMLQRLAAQVEQLLPSDQLGSLPALSATELGERLGALSELERDVSTDRRALHDIQDRLQEELVRRYRSGEANVDALLG
jgi:vacuolar-type H+-ATPase subunit I/STV1